MREREGENIEKIILRNAKSTDKLTESTSAYQKKYYVKTEAKTEE